MKDKVGTTDRIAFVLNGKPIGSDQPTPERTVICPKCGTDRLKQQCPLASNIPRLLVDCPIKFEAQ